MFRINLVNHIAQYSSLHHILNLVLTRKKLKKNINIINRVEEDMNTEREEVSNYLTLICTLSTYYLRIYMKNRVSLSFVNIFSPPQP